MGKKGRSKNKLAKMSEEERAQYLQQRADMEDEARRRKQQLISLFMKNKLKREDAFSRLNLAKINQEWRSIIRRAKHRELKNELLELEKFFGEALQRKDSIILRLLHDFDCAEEMYACLQHSQMEAISQMIGTQSQRIEFLNQIRCRHKNSVLEEWQADCHSFRQHRDQAQKQLECVLYQLEDSSAAEIKANHEKHLLNLEDLRSTMQLHLEEITKTREEKLEHLWSEYQYVLSSYVRNTETFYSEYMDLKEKDEHSTNMIRDHCYEIERAADQIASLKIEAANTEEDVNFQMKYLQKTRNDLSIRFVEMKGKLGKMVRRDSENFKYMVVVSHNALKFLEKIVKRGESILQLADVCGKLESEREKILPFGLSSERRQTFETAEDDMKKPPDGYADTDELFGSWKQMEKFWIRMNNARLDVDSLKQEKSSLELENARLKAELQEYMINFNISVGSNRHVNDFLAKRPNSMSVDRVVQIDLGQKIQSAGTERKFRRPITTCVDANFTNAVRSKRLAKIGNNYCQLVKK